MRTRTLLIHASGCSGSPTVPDCQPTLQHVVTISFSSLDVKILQFKGTIHTDASGDTCIMIHYRDSDFNLCRNVLRKMFQCQLVWAAVSVSCQARDTVKQGNGHQHFVSMCKALLHNLLLATSSILEQTEFCLQWSMMALSSNQDFWQEFLTVSMKF
jgi:hypothetical protein